MEQKTLITVFHYGFLCTLTNFRSLSDLDQVQNEDPEQVWGVL